MALLFDVLVYDIKSQGENTCRVRVGLSWEANVMMTTYIYESK